MVRAGQAARQRPKSSAARVSSRAERAAVFQQRRDPALAKLASWNRAVLMIWTVVNQRIVREKVLFSETTRLAEN